MNSAMEFLFSLKSPKIGNHHRNQKGGLFSWKFARLCPAQGKDDQLQQTVLSCSSSNSFQECVVERQWTSGSNSCCQSVSGTFSTKRRSRQTPQIPACTRLLWTASVYFAKCTALHAATLNRLVWDPRFSKVRVAGCKRHIGTWYTSTHLGVYSAN